uniref:Calcineurin-like phosphoesterase domain-containing protein n=1 Tax=Oncorhynchus mykiss TaxID=8022 RepID=A0A8C7TAZ5_ONCMY
MDVNLSSLETEVPFNKPEVVLTILHINYVFATALKVLQSLNPLIVFSGDCLSPSLLSTVTKGKHMVDVLNKLGVHCAVYGNHEFDFGVDLLEEHTKMMPFPWFINNVYDRFTSETLVHGLVINILERNALKIDFMGLVEEDWMDTLGTVDKNDIKYIDYVETADRLSAELRDKGADLGIALTHLRWRNGHDHECRVLEVNGIVIVKSGSEFSYISKSDVVKGQDWTFKFSCVKIATILFYFTRQHIFGEVLCHIEVALDGRYAAVRRAECNLGNLVIYAMLEATHAEVAFLKLRLLQLPFSLCFSHSHSSHFLLLQGLENGIRNYLALDGRFPQVSGIHFGFDLIGKPGRVIAETVKSPLYPLLFCPQGNDDYTMFRNQNLSTVLINHFESGRIVRCMKRCKSGHMMGLIKSLEGEVGVAVVPGVEGRIFHVHPEGLFLV